MRFLVEGIGLNPLSFVLQGDLGLQHSRSEFAQLSRIGSADDGGIILIAGGDDLGLGAEKQEREHMAVAERGGQQFFGVVAAAIAQEPGVGRKGDGGVIFGGALAITGKITQTGGSGALIAGPGQRNRVGMICHAGQHSGEEHPVQASFASICAADGKIKIQKCFFGGNVEFDRYIFRMSVAEHTAPSLAETDPQIASLINQEQKRQGQNIELIASENFTSRAVMEAQGSCLTNKYAEGYPAKRWYGGCEFVDEIETLAMDRAKQLFGADHANVQPHSGSSANMAVYFSVLKPGDKILTMDLSHGGHLTHGHPMNFSGQLYDVKHYGVEEDTGMIDYDKLAASAEEFQPKMITVGASAYSRIIDFERMGEIAESVGAYLFADIAHIAGLVAAGEHPSPVPYADFVTTTTHKTLRGPRSGLILCKEEHAKGVDSLVFPGCQGGPLVHVIAAKAVCFQEALQPEFKSYQVQVRKNAKALCEGMKNNGYDIISGDTENHVMLVDLQPKGINGKESQIALDHAGITCNKNAVPFDKQSPFKAGGIRLGSPAATTRGMLEPEMGRIADWIHQGIEKREDAAGLAAIRDEVYAFTANYPLPY